MRRWAGWAVLVAALVAIAAVGAWQTHAQQVTLQLGNKTYTLTRAVSKAQKEKGLSDTSELPSDRGMLFLSDHQGNQCYWMKNMHYPLDIIWLGSNKKVAHIEQNVPPDSYPQTFCASGQYVIELNAGEVGHSGLKPGQSVRF